MHVLGIGEILWDIFPDQELLGGAALNFCANVHRLGDSGFLLTAVGNDVRGQLAREEMNALGLATDFVQIVEELPTGVAIVSTGPDGDPNFTIQRPAAFDGIALSPKISESIARLEIHWIYFGTLLQMKPEIEQITHALVARLPATRCFYDMNLRADYWNFPLIQRLCHLASVLKLNEVEAQTLSKLAGIPQAEFSLETFCPAWAEAYGIDVICVTLGSTGCFVYENGTAHRIPGYFVTVHDTVGSGDAFSAAFLHGYHQGWPMLQTARFANALGALVASRAGATPDWVVDECLTLVLSGVPQRLGNEC